MATLPCVDEMRQLLHQSSLRIPTEDGSSDTLQLHQEFLCEAGTCTETGASDERASEKDARGRAEQTHPNDTPDHTSNFIA